MEQTAWRKWALIPHPVPQSLSGLACIFIFLFFIGAGESGEGGGGGGGGGTML